MHPLIEILGAEQIPVKNHDTAQMGMVCHRYSILATIPVPIKPSGHLPQVYPYLCPTLPILAVPVAHFHPTSRCS